MVLTKKSRLKNPPLSSLQGFLVEFLFHVEMHRVSELSTASVEKTAGVLFNVLRHKEGGKRSDLIHLGVICVTEACSFNRRVWDVNVQCSLRSLEGEKVV